MAQGKSKRGGPKSGAKGRGTSARKSQDSSAARRQSTDDADLQSDLHERGSGVGTSRGR